MLPSTEKFEEWVKEYLMVNDDHDNTDNMWEYVDGLIPHSFYGIWKQFDEMNLEIEQHQVGMPIWKIMQINLFESYYAIFVEVYEELTAYD